MGRSIFSGVPVGVKVRQGHVFGRMTPRPAADANADLNDDGKTSTLSLTKALEFAKNRLNQMPPAEVDQLVRAELDKGAEGALSNATRKGTGWLIREDELDAFLTENGG